MVKVEDSWDSDGSSEYNLVKGDVGPSSSKPSAPILVKQESLPSSSSGHLRSYFLGMGFSSVLVDKVLEENGDADVNLLLEALFRYSKSSPNASDSLDDFSVSDMGGDNSPIGFAPDDVKQEIKEPNGNLNDDLDKRSHLAVMNFSEEEIGLAIDRLGENASLDELVDFIVTAQTTGYSGGEGMDGSANVDHGKDEEATTAALYGTADKTLALLQMGFTENEVSSAIKNFGPEVPISELADSIFANRLACKVEKEEDFSDTADNNTWQNQNGLGCRDNNTEEYPKFSRSFNDPWISKVSSSKAANFSSVRMQPTPHRFLVSCAAKPETVEKVCEIVRKQLALPEDTAVSGESKFSSLGADSLDTVEIVMGLEEEFGISVEEDSAQSINTVQDAADLIDKLVESKSD